MRRQSSKTLSICSATISQSRMRRTSKRSGQFAAAGKGDVDWDLYLTLLNNARFSGALILHGLAEFEVTSSVELLAGKLKAIHA